MAEQSPGGAAPITIKKYANRRLYNTASSSYVTLDSLCQMVKEGVDFVVYDAKTGEDITRSVLTQIIVEEEAKGPNLLPIAFLRQLISFYGDNLQFLVPRYLEHSMASFARNQEQMKRYMQDTFGSMFPFGQFEEMSKQNLALFERAVKMFSPLGAAENGHADRPAPPPQDVPPRPDDPPATDRLGDLKMQVDALQKQLDALTRQKTDKPD